MENRTSDPIGCDFVMHGAKIQVGNVVNRARIVDMVGCNLGCIGGAGRFGVGDLPAEVAVLQSAGCGILCSVEDLLAKILVADSGVKVMPGWVLHISRGMQRVGAYVAEG